MIQCNYTYIRDPPAPPVTQKHHFVSTAEYPSGEPDQLIEADRIFDAGYNTPDPILSPSLSPPRVLRASDKQRRSRGEDLTRIIPSRLTNVSTSEVSCGSGGDSTGRNRNRGREASSATAGGSVVARNSTGVAGSISPVPGNSSGNTGGAGHASFARPFSSRVQVSHFSD